MSEAVLTSKGQITIPKEIRDFFSLEVGDRMDFIPENDLIIVVPLKKRNILDVYGSVKHRGKPLNFKKLRENMAKDLAKRALK